jgi:hypothetical protein
MAQRSLQDEFEEDVKLALKKTGDILDAQFTEEISAVKWDFPTNPKIRDIVDTGRLRASQTRVQNPDGSISFTWPLEYANEVHEGGVFLSGEPFPGRPWTEKPLEEFPENFDRILTEITSARDR